MNLFNGELFLNGILPFLLVFVLIYAVLQKTKVLGDNKSQIDALVSLAMALMLVAFPTPRNYIIRIVPWLAVALVVLLVIFLIYGFGSSDKDRGIVLPEWFKKNMLWVAIVFVTLVVLSIAVGLDGVRGWFNTDIFGYIIVALIIGVVFWVVTKKE